MAARIGALLMDRWVHATGRCRYDGGNM